jgi:hypothetical protein
LPILPLEQKTKGIWKERAKKEGLEGPGKGSQDEIILIHSAQVVAEQSLPHSMSTWSINDAGAVS